jgi:hypothetical protein
VQSPRCPAAVTGDEPGHIHCSWEREGAGRERSRSQKTCSTTPAKNLRGGGAGKSAQACVRPPAPSSRRARRTTTTRHSHAASRPACSPRCSRRPADAARPRALVVTTDFETGLLATVATSSPRKKRRLRTDVFSDAVVPRERRAGRRPEPVSRGQRAASRTESSVRDSSAGRAPARIRTTSSSTGPRATSPGTAGASCG